MAARSYAYRATGGSGTFDVYCTTASQMYGGADAETAATDKAVTATRGIVPKYKGTPIVAYFFSTSGGHTENIENVWTRAAPVPYLKGVPDPYDTTSPYHIWPDNPIRRTPARSPRRLGFTKGPLRAIYVVKRGTSPRVVKALLIGDRAATLTDGATLRAGLGLRDTWVYFTSLSITTPSRPSPTATATLTGRPLSGGRLAAARATLHGRPAGGSWTTAPSRRRPARAPIDGYTVKYTAFSAKVTPAANGRYYFTATTQMGETAKSATSSSTCGPPSP